MREEEAARYSCLYLDWQWNRQKLKIIWSQWAFWKWHNVESEQEVSLEDSDLSDKKNNEQDYLGNDGAK